MRIDNLVLGAGIAGLAYAYEKSKSCENTVVCEANPFPGGLCHSFTIQSPMGAFTFDSAVHLSFSTNETARAFFDKTEYVKHEPIASNYINGHWLKHPAINNLFPLDMPDKVSCIKSFVERREYPQINNYGEWLKASYGAEIASRFYYPYTRKYWTVEPEALTTAWMGIRLNKPDIEKMLYGSFSPITGNDYYAQEMRYPSGNGGYETFLKPLVDRGGGGGAIEYNKRAVKIDADLKQVQFSDGTRYGYNTLVSSLPLPELAQMIEKAPVEIQEKAKKLKASKVSLVSIGFRKPGIAKYLWFYIYDEDILAARVNSPGIKSKENVPMGTSSLQFEIYHYPGNVINKDAVIENVLKSLKKMNICNEDDIIFADYRLLPCGNVIFLQDMEKDRDSVKEYVAGKGIKLIGRFGEWDYLWSDQSYLSGKTAV
jgi:protoporphyrinogen oxidase